MKQFVFSIVCGFIATITIMFVLLISVASQREQETLRTLKKATKQAITSIVQDKSIVVSSDEEFQAKLIQLLVKNLNTGTTATVKARDDDGNYVLDEDGNYVYENVSTEDKNLKLVVEIVESDYQKGIISCVIVEEYTTPAGTVGAVSYPTTVIFDRKYEQTEYSVTYMTEGRIFKNYTLHDGESIRTACYPDLTPTSMYGKAFKGWTTVENDATTLVDEGTIKETIPSGNVVYYALYETVPGSTPSSGSSSGSSSDHVW